MSRYFPWIAVALALVIGAAAVVELARRADDPAITLPTPPATIVPVTPTPDLPDPAPTPEVVGTPAPPSVGTPAPDPGIAAPPLEEHPRTGGATTPAVPASLLLVSALLATAGLRGSRRRRCVN